LVRARALVDIATDNMSGSVARRYFVFIVRLLDCGPLGHLKHHLQYPAQRQKIPGTAKLHFGKLNSGLEQGPENQPRFRAASNGA
jgi:hypothetical protein